VEDEFNVEIMEAKDEVRLKVVIPHQVDPCNVF
jgi:hypothetical protein